MKKYGVSKRLKRVRDGFNSLYDAFRAAIKRRDHEAILRYNKEVAAYIRKYRQELRLTREFVGKTETDTLKMAKIVAEIAYEEAKAARLRREAEELEQEIYKDVQKEEASGRLKWN